MSSQPDPVQSFVEARISHRRTTALQLEFRDGPGEPFARAVQGEGDGIGTKIGILFGFKTGGPGTHILTYRDRAKLHVSSRAGEATVVTRPDGTEVASIERGDSSLASTPEDGGVLEFCGDPAETGNPDAFRLLVRQPNGDQVGRLDVIRTVGGWNLDDVIDYALDLADPDAGSDTRADQRGRYSPYLGVRLMLRRRVSSRERDILLAACVDTAIGLSPFTAEMAAAKLVQP